MDKIIIENLEVFSRHGVLKEERVLGQKFLLSMELFCDIREAGSKDDLSLTLDYGKVCAFINRFMTENIYYLIEAAAEKLCRALLIRYSPLLREVSLTIKKPWAPVGLPLKTVGVSIKRSWHRAYIGVGSNMGDRAAYIEGAIKAFDENGCCRVEKRSKMVETKPYGKTDQPDFLNMALELGTLLSPSELLKLCMEIEAAGGRVRTERWGERTLDLDILLYDDEIIDMREPDLVVPHYDMQNRDFVLGPLNEIAPYALHPGLHRTVREMYEILSDR